MVASGIFVKSMELEGCHKQAMTSSSPNDCGQRKGVSSIFEAHELVREEDVLYRHEMG